MSCSFQVGTIIGGLITMGSSLCACLPWGEDQKHLKIR